jgi:uncharacterized membrane protein YheB (UPF0754 family)
MVFIKALIFIVFNLLSGYLIVFAGKALLFLPRKPKFWNGKQIPFTPGFLYRKKDWLIQKIRKWVDDYLRDTKIETADSRISKWEKEAFDKAWAKFEFVEKPKFIPHFIKEQAHYLLSILVYELMKQFLRSFVPFLIKEYKLEKYINLAEMKLDVDILYHFFQKYIYKYLLYFSLAFFFLVGFGNMILYFIVH